MKTVSRFKFERSRFRFASAALVGVVAVALWRDHAGAQSAPAECVQAGKNCTFAISQSFVQKVPSIFKLQAQISQAKIPLGDAVFTSLVVKVKSGNTEICSEPFSQVRVRGGVLNLEIGRNIQGCQLDDEMAKRNDLAFQVCIGDSGSEAGNCLKPIQMSSVPYAVKASFASQAQEAYRSELASRAHYAQRITADGGMLEQPKIGAGYYEFLTPAAPADVADLTSVNPTAAGDVHGGFVQWAAVNPLERVLNVSAKNPNDTVLKPLVKFLVHAADSNFWGRVGVLGTSAFGGRATFSDGIAATGALSTFATGVSVASGGVSVASGGVSVGNGGVNVVNGGVSVASGGISVASGGVSVSGAGTMNVQVPASFGNGVKATGGVLDVQTAASFGAPSASVAVNFGAGTTSTFVAGSTVDMHLATVLLPPNIQVAPAITTDEYTSSNASGCTNASAAIGKVFCGISTSSPFAALGSCTLLVTNGRYVLRACQAFCAARCF